MKFINHLKKKKKKKLVFMTNNDYQKNASYDKKNIDKFVKYKKKCLSLVSY